MQKNIFTTIKIGYSTGVYGCTGEYFVTIIIKDGEMFQVHHNGLYGSAERINMMLKDAGYTEKYIRSFFGKMTRDDYRGIPSEYDAIEEVKSIIETGEYL